MFGIYAVGHISGGAHFNAAVTFAFALTRHFPWPRALAYGARSSSARSAPRRCFAPRSCCLGGERAAKCWGSVGAGQQGGQRSFGHAG
jgi:Major intrinsic protein